MSWGKPPAQKAAKPSSGLTSETQSFIDGLINNKNMSRRAADDIHEAVARGSPDWVNTLNKGVASRKPTGHLDKAHRPKVSTPKVGTASRHTPPPSLPTGTFSGKRMQLDIQATLPHDREQYQTRVPGPDREKEKDRLARRFEMGREAAMRLEAIEMDLENRARRGEPLRASTPAETKQGNAREELIDQILDEIEQRRAFLEEMRSKGRSQKYEAQMKGEIAERLAQLRKMGVTS